MRLLILSYFYYPDFSAGSFRTKSLVDSLMGLNDPKLEIEIITTQPNRYRSNISRAEAIEELDRVKVYRVQNIKNNGSVFSQAISFIKFATEARNITRKKKYDLIYATSSRLMTASLGAYISNKTNAPLYLDIRDIFVDTLREIHLFGLNSLLNPFFLLIERWTISSASHVNLVSPGFSSYFLGRYPNQSFSFFTNGIDEDFIGYKSRSDSLPLFSNSANPKLSILYAGNIGEGQGLEKIIPNLASRLGKMVSIKLIGDGGKRDALLRILRDLNIENVTVLNPISRSELLKEYELANILFLHLNSYSAFEKVIPSKVFEYAALGKPILAGVAGFAKEFIEAEIENAQVFEPCDVESAVIALNKLRLETAPRAQFIKKYRRTTIMNKMSQNILRFK